MTLRKILPIFVVLVLGLTGYLIFAQGDSDGTPDLPVLPTKTGPDRKAAPAPVPIPGLDKFLDKHMPGETESGPLEIFTPEGGTVLLSDKQSPVLDLVTGEQVNSVRNLAIPIRGKKIDFPKERIGKIHLPDPDQNPYFRTMGKGKGKDSKRSVYPDWYKNHSGGRSGGKNGGGSPKK